MLLRLYLRNKIYSYIRPNYIDEKCKKCGNTDKLELHHDKQFSLIVKECLDKLGLEYKRNTEDYSKEELWLIKNLVLGVHTREKYTTLCKSCHELIHKTEQTIHQFLIERKQKEEIVIPDEEVFVFLTNKNRLFRSKYEDYNKKLNQWINLQLNEDESIIDISKGNTKEYTLLFSSFGKVYEYLTFDICDIDNVEMYADLNLLIKKEEFITNIYDKKLLKDSKYIVMATKYGKIKKVEVEEINYIQRSGKMIMSLVDNDVIADVECCNDGDIFSICTKNAYTVRFKESVICLLGRTATGVISCNLSDGDYVISLTLENEDKQYLLTVSSNGYAKVTDINEFLLKDQRGGKGLLYYKLVEKCGEIVKSIMCNTNDYLLINNNNKLINIPLNTIPHTSRSAIGAKIIKLKDNEEIKMIYDYSIN